MATINFNEAYIKTWFTLGGPEEAEGKIRNANMYIKDYYYGCNTFEEAETKMINTCIENIKMKEPINLVIGGNLSNQLRTLNNSLKKYKYPYLGIYSACSSFIEGLIIGSTLLKDIDNICVVTSSHKLVSERQFRFPNEYGSMKKHYQTETITAAISLLLTNQLTKYKINTATIGKVIDYDIKDAANMGAVMAPSAAYTIYEHLKNTNHTSDYYDLIITGDLGTVGLNILKELLLNTYEINPSNVIDAGCFIYPDDKEVSGGSGPTCLPFYMLNKILKNRNIKRILAVGTGSLHNTTMVNQHNSIPSISHAIEIEVIQ